MARVVEWLCLAAFARSRLGRSSGSMDQTTSNPRHPPHHSRNHYIPDPHRRRATTLARDRARGVCPDHGLGARVASWTKQSTVHTKRSPCLNLVPRAPPSQSRNSSRRSKAMAFPPDLLSVARAMMGDSDAVAVWEVAGRAPLRETASSSPLRVRKRTQHGAVVRSSHLQSSPR